MIIEDAERLRLWLTAILQPLCDADPAALAKYVLALIKKDKPEKELRQSMSDQLEVFLQNETEQFVDKLFELHRTGEYMTKAPPPMVKKDVAPPMDTSEIPGDEGASLLNLGLENTGAGGGGGQAGQVGGPGADAPFVPLNKDGGDSAPGSKEDLRKRDRNADERDRSRRNRRPSRSPVRGSRRRGRSGSRTRDRRYHPRKNWNSSRRRSRSPGGRGNRSVSPLRNRSPPPRYRRPHSRSRTRSPRRSRSRSPTGTLRAVNDKVDSMHLSGGEDHRKISSGEGSLKEGEKPSLQSVIVKAGSTDKPEKGNRCKDFDERGLCMRGELCPYDHGSDPVVLEDVVIPGVTSSGPSLEYNRGMPDGYGSQSTMMRPSIPPTMGEYYPDNPAIDSSVAGGWGNPNFRPRGMGFDPILRGRGGGMMRGSPPIGPYTSQQRELISVPVMGMPGMQPDLHAPPMMGMHPHSMRGMHAGRGRGRGGFDHSRLGFKPIRNYANCALEVKKIPREQNNIMDLNSHFQKFGKIINIQINFEGDLEAALVTFSSPQEAQAAYRSTEAVLNNRFIRVFWHNKEKENEESVEGESLRMSIKDRLGGHEGEGEEQQEKIMMSGTSLIKTVYNPAMLASKKTEAAAEKVQAVEAIKKSQAQLAAQESLRKAQEEKKKESMKLLSDLRKKKQEMIVKQLEQQKLLISKLEAGKDTMRPEEKGELMSLIKVLHSNIEKIKNDLVEDSVKNQTILGNPPAPAVPTKSKEEAQREMLDAELELYNKEQEGGDTVDLEKKISELRAKARILFRGRGSYRGAPRGYMSGRGRGRGGRMAHRSLRTVDRRPTKIIVTGFPFARMPEILPHFSQFGVITEYDTDASTPSMMLNYDSRKSAELAMNKGRMFGESVLEIKWAVNPSVEGDNQETGANSKNGDASHRNDNGASIEDDELGDILANEILLTYEDEEEDDEDRSWRR